MSAKGDPNDRTPGAAQNPAPLFRNCAGAVGDLASGSSPGTIGELTSGNPNAGPASNDDSDDDDSGNDPGEGDDADGDDGAGAFDTPATTEQ